MLENIVKASENFKELAKEYSNNKLSSSILLISKDTFFAQQFARVLSMLVFDGKACLDCENCKKVMADAHPDLKIYPSKDKLVVAESEEIVMESFIKPIFASKKVFIIRSIDEALDSAQNKLLKVLEEPQKNVQFILTCSNQEKVLPTIRSRCTKIDLKKLDDQTILSVLSGGEQARLALELADGQIGRAITLEKKKNLKSLADDSVAIITKMKNSKQVLSFSKKLQDYKEDFNLILEIIAFCISDMLKIKAGQADKVKLKSYCKDLQSVKDEYTIRALCEIASLLDSAIKEKTYNVNLALALENFLLNILEVKYLCK